MKNNAALLFLERHQISIIGVSLGLLFFAASLTPSLIPRSAVIQGLLGGITIATGYLFSVILLLFWDYLGLPGFKGNLLRKAGSILFLGCFFTFMVALYQLRDSQNELRALMGMEAVGASHELTVIGLALFIFVLLFLLGRMIVIGKRYLQAKMPRRLPPRVAISLSLVLVALISWNLANGVIARGMIDFSDQALQELDAIIDPELPVPEDKLRSGSSASLIAWETLGAQGRRFIAGGYSATEINDISGGAPTKQPIRIYAGLNSAENEDERANLVLREMLRVGAFNRSVLVVVTPTGSGWIDSAAVDPLEVLHRGDTSIVGMQYSYLLSPLALYVEPERAPASAVALVNTIYNYWRELPENKRPRLYLHGLSLGSYGSERALSPLNIIDDPPNGALWSGPTFANPVWKDLTRQRNPGSPVWLPTVGDSRTARFTNQANALEIPGSSWARMRLVFLQYPSDPITFFELGSAFRSPTWMQYQRAPDVLDGLRWYPLITILQLAFDMLIATDVPKGFGHVFAAEHYIDAWVALTDPKDWPPKEVERLKAVFR